MASANIGFMYAGQGFSQSLPLIMSAISMKNSLRES